MILTKPSGEENGSAWGGGGAVVAVVVWGCGLIAGGLVFWFGLAGAVAWFWFGIIYYAVVYVLRPGIANGQGSRFLPVGM